MKYYHHNRGGGYVLNSGMARDTGMFFLDIRGQGIGYAKNSYPHFCFILHLTFYTSRHTPDSGSTDFVTEKKKKITF